MMLKSMEQYSISELIFSLEKELDELKKQNQPEKNKKSIQHIEQKLTVLWEFLVLKE